MIKFGPNYNKLKTSLQLIRPRLEILEAKNHELAEKLKREIANYLIDRKYALAKIKAQTLLRYEATVIAMELMGLYCHQILERYPLFEKNKELDPSLTQAVTSLIWAAPYMQAELHELQEIVKQISNKFGHKFLRAALKNKKETVNPELIDQVTLFHSPPSKIHECLRDIAKKYGISPESTTEMEKYFLRSKRSKESESKNNNGPEKEISAHTSKEDEKHKENIRVFDEFVDNPSTKQIFNEEGTEKQINETQDVDKQQIINETKCEQTHMEQSNLNTSISGTEMKQHEIIRKCEHYEAKVTHDQLYPDASRLSSSVDINYNNTESQMSTNREDTKIKENDLCKSTNDTCLNDQEINDTFEEPPPSYDVVIGHDIMENHNLNSKVDINDNLQPDEATEILPTCPSELPDVDVAENVDETEI